MANIVKHKFTSLVADDPDSTIVRPSNWNDEHIFAGGSNSYSLRYDSSATDKVKWTDDSIINISWPGFNAVGDDLTLNTTAIQTAIDAAEANKKFVYIPHGIFQTNSLRIGNGCRGVVGPGTLKTAGTTAQALLELDGSHFSTTPVDDCVIQDISIDCGKGVVVSPCFQGIFVSGGNKRVRILGVNLFNCSDAQGAAGVRLRDDVQDSVVAWCTVRGVLGTTPSTSDQSYGIATLSVLSTAFGGMFDTGLNTADPANSNFNNKVIGNTVEGFTHGIYAGSAYRNIYTNNVLRNQGHRSIIMVGLCKQNIIAHNQCFDFGSSGIHGAFNIQGNKILNNQVISTVATGEAGIQIYVGAANNTISDNFISCQSDYGIYLGVSQRRNRIINNYVERFALAGIALEASWANGAPPVGAVYSRPNTVAVSAPYTTWNFDEGFGNTIKGNTIGEGDSNAVCGIYLASVSSGTGVELKYTTVSDNDVLALTPDGNFVIYEETSGKLSNVKSQNNTWIYNASGRFAFTRSRLHFDYLKNNQFLNDGNAWRASTTEATPSIAYADYVEAANGSAQDVTGFIGGMKGQDVYFRLDANTTLKHNASGNIRTISGADITGDTNDIIKFLMVSSTVAIQV